MGICCPCFCGESCSKVFFDVFDHNNNRVSSIIKGRRGCIRAAVSDSEDSYHITFPEEATPDARALLFATGLFLDYNYFEK